MTTARHSIASPLKTAALSLLLLGLAIPASAPAVAQGKGEPQANKCDKLKKGSPEWKRCTGTSHGDLNDQDLYYAGYWLARTGQYDEALSYLTRARVQDERILTYIGFATRKRGDINSALSFYDRALTMNPNYTVARAYLGEAYLGLGQRAKAVHELQEIERRCGTACPEYAELKAALDQAG